MDLKVFRTEAIVLALASLERSYLAIKARDWFYENDAIQKARYFDSLSYLHGVSREYYLQNQ